MVLVRTKVFMFNPICLILPSYQSVILSGESELSYELEETRVLPGYCQSEVTDGGVTVTVTVTGGVGGLVVGD